MYQNLKNESRHKKYKSKIIEVIFLVDVFQFNLLKIIILYQLQMKVLPSNIKRRLHTINY